MLKEYCDICGDEIPMLKNDISQSICISVPSGDKFGMRDMLVCETCAAAVKEAHETYRPIVARMLSELYEAVYEKRRRERNAENHK